MVTLSDRRKQLNEVAKGESVYLLCTHTRYCNIRANFIKGGLRPHL